MPLPEILSSALGLSKPWRVKDASFSCDRKRLDITVLFDHNEDGSCPHCEYQNQGEKTAPTTWFHDGFLNYKTYLHSPVPRNFSCPKIPQSKPPWVREGSKFVQVYEDEMGART
jgi:hypothetical protein